MSYLLIGIKKFLQSFDVWLVSIQGMGIVKASVLSTNAFLHAKKKNNTKSIRMFFMAVIVCFATEG